jgi:hypothetical protein
MAFPASPTNGQTTTINSVTYTFASASNSWTRTGVVVTVGTVSSAGPITLNGDQNLGAAGAYNSGSVTNGWATVYATNFAGTASTAKYADLAEMYKADKEYGPGTVLVLGGRAEVTETNMPADYRVVGVVSTEPAYLMNSHCGGISVPIALRGRVPLKVVGLVSSGDLLITSEVQGYAKSIGGDTSYGPAIFAKAITSHAGQYLGSIEAVIL